MTNQYLYSLFNPNVDVTSLMLMVGHTLYDGSVRTHRRNEQLIRESLAKAKITDDPNVAASNSGWLTLRRYEMLKPIITQNENLCHYLTIIKADTEAFPATLERHLAEAGFVKGSILFDR